MGVLSDILESEKSQSPGVVQIGGGPMGRGIVPADQPAQARQPTGSMVLDTLANLDRPRNALATAVRNYSNDESFLEGLKDGFSLDSPVFGAQDLTPDDLRKRHPIGMATTGVVFDIATDPLTYIPGSAFVAPWRILKKVADVTGATKLAVSFADNGAFKALNIHFGDSEKAHQALLQYNDLKNAYKYEIIRDSRKMRKDLDVLANELNVTPDELNATIIDDIERGKRSEDARVAAIQEQYAQRNKDILETEKSLGVKVSDYNLSEHGELYFPHVLTKEGKSAIGTKEILGWISGKPTLVHSSTKMRKLEGTVQDINARTYYGVDKLFLDDPVAAQAIREIRHAQVVAGSKYIESVRELGLPLADAPPTYIKVPGIDDAVFDPAVANEINNATRVIFNPEEMSKVLRVYDSTLLWFKMWSLGARFAYHARNIVGNAWNCYLAGMDGIRVYDAGKLQDLIRRDALSGAKVAGMDAEKLHNLAVKNGIMGRGQYSGDILTDVGSDVGAQSTTNVIWKNTLSTENPVLQLGFEVGHQLEQNARLALFIDGLKRGMTDKDAAMRVKKYLFDYEDLSRVERDILKRIFPFYTWSRKNIPLQLEMMFTRPDKFQKINIVKGNMEQDVDVPDQKNVEGFVKRSGPIYYGPKGMESDVKKMMGLLNYLPAQDVERLPNLKSLTMATSKQRREEFAQIASDIGSMVYPAISAPVQYFFNYDIFRQKAIEEFEGQTEDFIGVKMPVHLAHLARNIVMLNELDRLNPGNMFGVGQMNYETGEIIRTPSFGMNGEIGNDSFAIGATRETRTDLPGGERLVQYIFGLRAYSVNDEAGAAKRVRLFRRDLLDLQKRLPAAGRMGREREAKELKSSLDKLIKEFEK